MRRIFLLIFVLGFLKTFGQGQEVISSSGVHSFIDTHSDQPDLYTGANAFSIPIYTITSGENLRHDISLNYRSNGVNIAEVPDWTGTDWTLRAGGVISIEGTAGQGEWNYTVSFNMPGYSGSFPVNLYHNFQEIIDGSKDMSDQLVFDYENVKLYLNWEVFGYGGTFVHGAHPVNIISTPSYTAYFEDQNYPVDNYESTLLGNDSRTVNYRLPQSNYEQPTIDEKNEGSRIPIGVSAIYMTRMDAGGGNIIYFDYSQVYAEYPGANKYSLSKSILLGQDNYSNSRWESAYHAYYKPVLKRIRTNERVVEFITESIAESDGGFTDSGLLLKEIIIKAQHRVVTNNPPNIAVTSYDEIARYKLDYDQYESTDIHMAVPRQSYRTEGARLFYRTEWVKSNTKRPYLSKVYRVGLDGSMQSPYSFDYYDPTVLPDNNTYKIGPFGKYLDYASIGSEVGLVSSFFHYDIGVSDGIDYNENVLDIHASSVIGDGWATLNGYKSHIHPNVSVAKFWGSGFVDFNNYDNGVDYFSSLSDAEVEALLDNNFEYSAPDWSDVHYGMLHRITLPTGAMVEYDYFDRKYGALLKSRSYLNADNTLKKKVNYTYEQGALPRGIVPLSFLNKSYNGGYYAYFADAKNGSFFRYNGQIGFGKVTEELVGGGTKVYSFTTAEDYDNAPPFFWRQDNGLASLAYENTDPSELHKYVNTQCMGLNIDNEAKRGLLKQLDVFDENDYLVSRTAKTYDFFEYQYFREVQQNIDNTGDAGGASYTAITYQPTIGVRVQTDKTTTYFEEESQHKETLMTYTYNESGTSEYPINVRTEFSDGTIILEDMDYQLDGRLDGKTTYINGEFQKEVRYQNHIGFIGSYRPTQISENYGDDWVTLQSSTLENGLITSISTSGSSVEQNMFYNFDDRKLLLNSGQFSINIPDADQLYTYNNRDELTMVTNADGVTTSFTYDQFGRLSETIGPDGRVIEKKEYIEPLFYEMQIDGPSEYCNGDELTFLPVFPETLDVTGATFQWYSPNSGVGITNLISTGEATVATVNASCARIDLKCTATLTDGTVMVAHKKIKPVFTPSLNFIKPDWSNDNGGGNIRSYNCAVQIDISQNTGCSNCVISHDDLLSVQFWLEYQVPEGFTYPRYNYETNYVVGADPNWTNANFIDNGSLKTEDITQFLVFVDQGGNPIINNGYMAEITLDPDRVGEAVLKVKFVTKEFGEYIFSEPLSND